MKTMSHSNLPRDNFLLSLLLLLLLLLLLFLLLLLLLLLLLVKRMFSSLLRVVAIRFSHRKQWLIVTSVNIVPSASLHLNQIFYFYLYLYIKKMILLLNTNNLHKPQTFFLLIRAILPLICWRVFLGDPHIHLTSIISGLIQFQIFYIFLKGSYTVNMLLKMPLFWTFWKFMLPLILIFYIHLTCTYYVRLAPILSICLLLFLTCL